MEGFDAGGVESSGFAAERHVGESDEADQSVNCSPFPLATRTRLEKLSCRHYFIGSLI